jgi:hypothetical protein
MIVRMNGALRRGLAGSILGGLTAFTAVPAMSQWLPPWVATRGDIRQSLEAQGYVLIAPLHRRPFVYLADVSAGPAGYQRLVIDARSGEILQRFMTPPRRWGPQLAERGGDFPPPPPPGFGRAGPAGGFSTLPNASPAAKSAYGGPANVHIPAAISPFGSPDAPSGPKSKSAPTVHNKVTPGTAPVPPPRPSTPEDADYHVAPGNSGAAPPDAQTPLAPTTPAPTPTATPAQAATPNESTPAAPAENLDSGRPKTDSAPPDRNALPNEAVTQDTPEGGAATPTPDLKPDTPKTEAQTEPSASAQPMSASPESTPKPAAPESDAEPSEKSKVNIVPATLAE